jgi:hypothetical protein
MVAAAKAESDLTMKRHCLDVTGGRAVQTVFLLLFIFAGTLSAASRRGVVQFSNGESLEGRLSLTAGAELKIHDGKTLRTLAFDRLQEIRVRPADEKMVQKWRFLEAGQTKKEFSGQPYLTRSLEATAVLAGGDRVTGHLFTTVLYVEGTERTSKVILQAKQRGQEGEAADKLRYPSLIRFTDNAAGADAQIRLRLNHGSITPRTQAAVQTWGALFTLEAKPGAETGEFKLPSPLGMDMFLALRTGNEIVAGWPANSDPGLMALVQTNLGIAEDFYDDRNLLGVVHDKANENLYSLVMLERKGKTTLDAAKSQPWRLVILRWKYDEESGRVLLAGRGYFFRGILEKEGQAPVVKLDPALWKLRQRGEVWVNAAE